MQRLEKEFMTSIATVAMVILAVAVYIYYGARAVFYIVVVIAAIVGFANAYLISKAAPGAPAPVQAQRPTVNIGAPRRRRARKTARK